MVGGHDLGITDAERQAVIAALERRAALGHIGDAELTSRTSRARTAMTRAGLDGLLLDLPPDPGGDPLPFTRTPAATRSDWADLEPHTEPAPTTPTPPTATTPATTATTPPKATTPTPIPITTPPGSLRPPPPARLTAPPAPGRSSERAAVARAGDLVPKLVAAVVVAAFGLAIVAAGQRRGSSDDTDTGSTREESITVPAPTTGAPTTSTTPTAPAPPVTSAPPPTAPPIPEQQRLVVGTDLAPGRHMQPDGVACYWEIQDAGGEPSAFGAGDRPVLDVRAGEVVVLDFCGELVPYAPAATPATSVGSGDWLVGEDVVAGTYRPSASDFCFWERASGFRHDYDEIIEWDDTGRDVTLHDGERFSSDGCGTWTKV